MYKADNESQASVPEKIAHADKVDLSAYKTIEKETGVPEAEIYGVGSFFHLLNDKDKKIRVCQGLSCRMQGSEKILQDALDAGLPAIACSCLAACDRTVPVLVERSTRYDVTSDDIQNTQGDWTVLKEDFDATYDKQLSHIYQSEDESTLAFNLKAKPQYEGKAFAKAQSMSPTDIVKELNDSGLQGRGGAGFPAGRKWDSLLSQKETHRYVVLNADEGEPGTFKDRELLIRRPDLVLEGLAIAAHTIGATEVYLYIRGEFAFPITIVAKALETIKANNLYPNIHFHIHEGHGAYICGEETALLEALEGKRGMPRLKPPFPTEVGLWGKPTLIHNVETIAAVPYIIEKGGEAFNKLGKTGPGSKLYCLSGHVAQPGVYEMPLGVTLDELVEAAGGYIGIPKAFSPGGASSGFLPMTERNRPLDFTSLRDVGSSIGSAGVVVINETYDLKQAVKDELEFFEVESCGQCAPCRIGTRFQRTSLDRYIGCGNKAELENADDIGWEMTQGSICGLGHTASTPLLSMKKWFPEEFK